MLQSEFIKRYCENSEITEQVLFEMGLFAVPCDCGEKVCWGWAMESRQTIHNHVRLNIKYAKLKIHVENGVARVYRNNIEIGQTCIM